MASQQQKLHTGKTALITGACGGLGRHIADMFLASGANVVVCDVNDQAIAEFKEQADGAYPGCALVLKCNITDDAALDDMFSQAEQKFGHLDYVVNNAVSALQRGRSCLCSWNDQGVLMR